MSRRLLALLAAAVLVPLAGCDQLGIESATVTAARVEADGKAVGAACRHGGRAIEDCFALNKRVDKAAIYAGWRDMDDYMRENKIEVVPPTLGPGARVADKSSDGDDASPADDADKSDKSDKAAPKAADKSKAGDKAADKAGADAAKSAAHG
ncbi:MAG: hypothetical protein ACTHL8_03745 [Burkholderiaceae bacterium]